MCIRDRDKVQGEMELIGLPALKSISEDSEFMNTIPEGWKPFNKAVFYDALDYAVDGVVLNEIQDEIIKYELELLFAGEQDIDVYKRQGQDGQRGNGPLYGGKSDYRLAGYEKL